MNTICRSGLFAFSVALVTSPQGYAQVGRAGGLAERIGHYNPAKVAHLNAVHDGAGSMDFGPILGAKSLSTNLIFMHRGVINPHSGIGQHFHNHCEEMFVILDGPDAQFTINGRTSVLPTPAGAPDRLGSSHAIYNPSDKPVEWLNINVSKSKAYDTFDMHDDRVGAQLDPVPQFINFHIDPKLMKASPGWLHGSAGVQYRRLLDPTVFFTTWSYFDHILIPSGGKIAPESSPNMSEAYYIYKGEGTVTVNGETQHIAAGDAVPVDLGQSQSIAQSGNQPLELLVVGVAKDMDAKEAYISSSFPQRR